MGEFEEVIERAEKYLDSVEKEENLLFIKYFKALSLYKLGEKDSALDLFAEIYESSPDFLDVKDYIEEEAEVEKEVIEAPLVNREEETQEEPTEEIVEEEPEEVLEVISEDKEEEKVEEIKEVKEKIYKRDLKEHFIIL
jgi:tetratricopeptide (TPR) repeat protein